MSYVGRVPSSVPVTADDIPANSIDASKIIDGAIAVADVADNAITEAKIADAAVVSLKSGRKNLIINGAMQMAQRGTSFTAPSATYTLDRWKVWSTNTDGGFDVTQVTDGPSEFKSSLKATITSADTSLGATQFAIIRYPFEGQDIVGTASGTADAKTMTLSFWVKCSVTGTFGGALADGAFSYSFPFSYTVLAANTWEKKTVTITGATSGNFSNDITQGMQINFSMGSGSTYSGTANTWGSAGYFDATGTDAVIATNGATWQVTGVQLEVGDTATDFEHRSYGEELALCQRYYEILEHSLYYNPQDRVDIHYCQRKRTTASVTLSGTYSGDCSISDNGPTGFVAIPNGAHGYMAVRWQADAEL